MLIYAATSRSRSRPHQSVFLFRNVKTENVKNDFSLLSPLMNSWKEMKQATTNIVKLSWGSFASLSICGKI